MWAGNLAPAFHRVKNSRWLSSAIIAGGLLFSASAAADNTAVTFTGCLNPGGTLHNVAITPGETKSSFDSLGSERHC